MRSRALLPVVPVVLVVLAACGSRKAAPPPPGAPVELHLHLPSDPPHLNPLLSSDFVVTQVVLGDVYESLPALAERVEHSADEREWTFTLRAGVSWHDGKPFTTDDVVFTLKLLAPGGAPSVLAADFDDLQAVEVVDARTVRVRFAGFRLGRADTLALVPVLPAHVFAAAPAAELLVHPATRAPVGTGPYAFESWDPGREIRLRRHPGHRGPAPAAERVIYRIVPDRAQALAQLQAGELDLLLQIPPGPLLEQAAADARLRLEPYDFPYYLAVRWNCRAAPLSDPRVRRALTMLLDRDEIVRAILAGRGRVASAPWAPDDRAYDPSVAPWPFDPDAARALLAEAGVQGLRVEILVPQGSATLERIVTVWQDDAKRGGVTLVLTPDPGVIDRARAGDFQGAAYGWSTGPEQDFYHHFHSSQAGADNYGACGDAELDRLLDAVRATPDPAARQALEHQLHRRLHELELVTVIDIDVRTAVARKRLGGVHPGAHGAPARELTVSAP